MSQSSLDSAAELNQALLDEFKSRDDVKMQTQLPDYDNLQCFDLSNDRGLSVISKRISRAPPPPKPSRLKNKDHLFNAHIPKKLLMAIREIATNDKNDESAQGRLFRAMSKIPIPKTFKELGAVDFEGYGNQAAFVQI